MFRHTLQRCGLASAKFRQRYIDARRSRQARRLAIEPLERRDLFAVTPMAPITFGGQAVDAGYAIAVDEANNRYLTGIFSDTVDFDPGDAVSNLTSNGDFDIFVAKYSADGSLAWARGFGSEFQDTGADHRQSIAVDTGGNVYVLTTFAGTVAFDDTVLTSVPPSDLTYWQSYVVIRLDPSGNVEWAKSFDEATYARDLALHDPIGAPAASAVYVVGRFKGTQQFGTQQLSSTAGEQDAFLSRIDASTGSFTWTNQTSGKGVENFTGVAVDPAGSGAVYVTGHKFDEAIIGSFKFDKRSGRSALVAKADLNGTFQWAKLIATGPNRNPIATGWDIALGNGGIFVTGLFQDEYADFDSIRVRNANGKSGGDDIFVTQLDANGKVNWAIGVGSTSKDNGRQPAIAADALGNVFLAGVLGGQAQLGSDALPAGHFVSQIDAASGQFIKSWPLAAGIQFRNINTDPAGNLWVTGLFEGTATFPDGTTVTSNNASQDLFVQQFSNAPVVATAPLQATSSTDEPLQVDDSAAMLNTVAVESLLANPESTWMRKLRIQAI